MSLQDRVNEFIGDAECRCVQFIADAGCWAGASICDILDFD